MSWSLCAERGAKVGSGCWRWGHSWFKSTDVSKGTSLFPKRRVAHSAEPLDGGRWSGELKWGDGWSQSMKDLRLHAQEFGLGKPLEHRTRHNLIWASERSFWNPWGGAVGIERGAVGMVPMRLFRRLLQVLVSEDDSVKAVGFQKDLWGLCGFLLFYVFFFFGFQSLSKIKEQENFTLKYGNFSFHSVHTHKSNRDIFLLNL